MPPKRKIAEITPSTSKDLIVLAKKDANTQFWLENVIFKFPSLHKQLSFPWVLIDQGFYFFFFLLLI